MTRGEWVSESEFVLSLGRRRWTFAGWKADLLFSLALSPVLFVLIVGLSTIVRWFA